MQVILKPEPGNPQELYLGSLQALGVDTGANDVRFVEDNWESPVLGAWGLGWEVWLNGMEITQVAPPPRRARVCARARAHTHTHFSGSICDHVCTDSAASRCLVVGTHGADSPSSYRWRVVWC